MRNEKVIIFACALLAGCASNGSGPSPTEILYAASAALDQTEVAATVYITSPIADPAIKAQIKAYDNTAYSAIHPLVEQAGAGQSVVTAIEAQAAQAAVSQLSSYLISKGIK